MELAAQTGVRAALEWFRKERNWINEKHLSLCRIPAPTFFEQQRAEWFVQEFRSLGWDARMDRAGNVIAVRPGYESLPSVAVTAHLDTVFAPRNADEIRVSHEGRFTGPGVSDNGAGLAGLLAIAAAWNANPALRDGPPDYFTGAPVLIANVGEEGEGNLSGMRYICRGLDGRGEREGRGDKRDKNGRGDAERRAMSEPPRGFLVLDGPGVEHITSRALASRRFEIAIVGPGGHSWRDSYAGNPIHGVSRAITHFLDGARDLNAPRTSFNFGIIEGGVSINSIPTEALAKIDLRSESNDSLESLSEILMNAVELAADEESGRSPAGRLSARIKEIGSRPSGGLADDAPILETIRAVDSFLGVRSHLDCSSTDANIPLSMGLQAVSIGAGGHGGGAHTAAEWYSPEGRDAGLRRIFLSLSVLLAGE
ncbi:MAG: M20/M25/M40 family metallo-hydrolase [Bryobacteraceae bacterium]